VAFFGQRRLRFVDGKGLLLAAGVEEVEHRERFMDTNQRFFTGRNLPFDQRQMGCSAGAVDVGVQRKNRRGRW
jgi:hypothetical protein